MAIPRFIFGIFWVWSVLNLKNRRQCCRIRWDFIVNERFFIDLFRALFPSDYCLSFRENQFCEVLFALKVSGFLFLARSLMSFVSNLGGDGSFMFTDLMSARSAFDLRSLIQHRLHGLQENWSFPFFVYVQKRHYYFNYCCCRRRGSANQDKEVDKYILPCNEKWVAPRLDVSSVRRPRLLPFTETVFAILW